MIAGRPIATYSTQLLLNTLSHHPDALLFAPGLPECARTRGDGPIAHPAAHVHVVLHVYAA